MTKCRSMIFETEDLSSDLLPIIRSVSEDDPGQIPKLSEKLSELSKLKYKTFVTEADIMKIKAGLGWVHLNASNPKEIQSQTKPPLQPPTIRPKTTEKITTSRITTTTREKTRLEISSASQMDHTKQQTTAESLTGPHYGVQGLLGTYVIHCRSCAYYLISRSRAARN